MAIRNSLRTSVSLSACAVAMGLFAAPAFAQDATEAPEAAATEETEGEAIVVTGFRASLASATSEKKRADTIVESVKAEDIGKLPDNSIAESIGRLPGLAAQRANGRANIISIRGFGPDFSTTTLNGREQTTTNDSRAVEFDQFPSEILSGVDVYKTSQAKHTAGGLVGTIDLRTIRPLDVADRVIAVGARGSLVEPQVIPTVTNKGYRVFGTFVDKFADDTMGIALSAAYTDEPYHTRDWNAWGYGEYAPGIFGISGVKTWEEASRLKRLGVNGTFQAELGSQLKFTLDGFYSHFDEKLEQKGFEMPILCCGSTVTGFTSRPVPEVPGAQIVTSATWTGRPIIENYATDQKNDTYSVGGNLEWDNESGTRAMLDVSWSRTDRWQDRLETTAGLGRNLPTPGGTFGYTLTDHALEFTSDFNGANPNLVLTDVQGWSGSTIQAGYDKIRQSKDDLKEIRAEIEQDLGSGLFRSVVVGVDHVRREKTLTQDEAFLVPANGADSAAIPANLLLEPVELSRGFGPILSYDPRLLVPGGILDYIAVPYGDSQAYDVSEDVWTPYAMVNLETDLGNGNSLTGNIGVQAVKTKVTSVGAIQGSVSDDYWMVLPSLNLAVRNDVNDLVVRFAASEQFMRGRIPDLANTVNFGYNLQEDKYVGSGGNPQLRPYRALALDLSVEKYFGNSGYLAMQLFWKHLDQYIDSSGVDLAFDFSGYPTPPGPVPPSPIGILFGPANTEGGYLMGMEVAGTLPLDVFTQSLDGFGLTGGVGYTETKAFDSDGNPTEIPGYSKWVGNVTAFYDTGVGLNARASLRYRSDFLGDFSLFSGGLDRQSVQAEGVVDAQIGYNFAPESALGGLSIYLQGQNLTDIRQATTAQINGEPIKDAWLKYQTYGRRFLAGFTYKF